MIGLLSEPSSPGLAGRLFGLALLAFPRPLRAEYGQEMRATFAAAHAQRRRLGVSAAFRYTRRAFVDTLRAGLRERLGSRGLSATPPGSPLVRLVRRSHDMFLHEIWTDLRLSARSLRKTPAFTVTVLVVLALGIGINGAIFSAVRATILADPPYPEADRLVLLDLTLEAAVSEPESARRGGRVTAAPPAGRPFPWSYPKYEILAATEGLAADPIAAYATRTLTLTGQGDPVRLDRVEVVSADYFRVLGLTAVLGRDFAAVDAEPERALMLSHSLWRERFGSDPDVVGTTAVLNGEPMVVIGVGPAGFHGLSGEALAWVSMPSVPLLISTSYLGNFDGHWLQVVGRLRPGATMEEATAQMHGVGRRVDEAYPWSDPTKEVGGGVRSLTEARRNPQAQRAVVVVASAAGLVLLIGCANLAALLLARSLERRREIAVRLALGASRSRVARSVLVETLLLALVGSLLGLLVAARGVGALARAWPSDFLDGGWNLRFVDTASLALDPSTVLYTIALGIVAGVLFGVGPALRLSRADLGRALKEGERGGGDGAGIVGVRRLLVVGEIAMALVLLVGAGLMTSSLGRLLAVEPGFDPERLLVFQYSLPASSYSLEDAGGFHARVLERLRALPGVVEATSGCDAPLDAHCWISGVRRIGDREYEQSETPSTGIHIADSDLLVTLGISLRQGRWFESTDLPGSPTAVVISASAAREWFPDTSPLGQAFETGIGSTTAEIPGVIVGVVDDVLYDSPENGLMPEVYVSQAQEALGRGATILVRTADDPMAMVADVRTLVRAVDPDLPIFGVTTVADLAAAHLTDSRALMALLALFAAVALLLAAVGVWGLVSYAVTRRRRELGIRMALGAESGRILRLVVRENLISAAWGIAVGVGAGLLAVRVLAGLLYEVDAHDPTIFVAGAAILLSVAFLAAWLPARRVAQVDPLEAVRAE